ncbi:MAG: 16S rRNA (uracil(1498)-N(3))-methyltransferase [Spirochaetales bacterium]|nr:16S rRNA (uracil(1498)-N(3))-methyltransferase [Spirochaetales bacterium]
MKHLYFPFVCTDKKEIILKGPDFHYLTHVLRFKKGTSFRGIDVTGQRYLLQVKSIMNDSVLLAVEMGERVLEELPPIVLFQAFTKGKVMDRIIRQATETGVSRIIPVMTDHTIVQPTSGKSIENRFQRWGRIIKGALQQSDGAILPHVSPPLDIQEAIKLAGGLKLFFHQEKKENRTLHECLDHNSSEIDIFIGPEGGFSDSEYNFLKKSGFIPINLGDTVLRVDTAAIFALAAIKILLLEKEKWRKV